MASPQLVKAKFDFWAENETELSFRVGDIITVLAIDQSGEEGWWEGQLNGQRGLFPSNYVQPYTAPMTGGNTTNPYQPNNTKLTPNNTQMNMMMNNNTTNPGQTNGVQLNYGNTNGTTNGMGMNNNMNMGMPQQKYSVPLTSSPMPVNNNMTMANPQSSGASGNSKMMDLSAPGPTKVEKRETCYGLWASNMGIYAGVTNAVVGGGALFWHFLALQQFQNNYLYIGTYTAFSGLACLMYEIYYGQNRRPTKFPGRGIGYTLLSIPAFFAELTIYCGIFYLSIAMLQFLACYLGESSTAPPKKTKTKTIADDEAANWIEAIYSYFQMIRQQNNVGAAVFLLIYAAGNCYLFVSTVIQYYQVYQNAITDPNVGFLAKTSGWVSIAKGFGYLLDMNCALILVPVCRSMLRVLYNKSTADQGCLSRVLRGILYFIPVDHNLEFHRIIAWVILFASVGHTAAHVINYALTPAATASIYGLWPLISGGMLCHVMLYMYAGAMRNVMVGQFEIFWYSHHAFVLFFALLLVHGRGGLGPRFWMAFIGPGALYFLERCLRFYRAEKKVVVLSVTLMGDVFCLEIAKEGIFAAPYKEGQYVFIKSPPISQLQWHPFTISSPPQEKTVTVHIKVQGPGSWTRGLRDYVASMGRKGSPFFTLDRAGPSGKLAGKILGPDGTKMLELDGPYAAPTQHLGEYDVDFVVGAGIGVTPVAAAIRSVIFHRWKYFIGQCYPDHAYFGIVCAHRDIGGFRWLVRIIKDAQDEVIHMRTTNPDAMKSKSFQVHIWVTSVPDKSKIKPVVVDDEIGFWGVPREDANVERFRANWNEFDLYSKMNNPDKHSVMGIDESQGKSTAHADVHVYGGRPDWERIFTSISQRHPANKIGVEFCGNPLIAKDLGKMCYRSNKNRASDSYFVFHKENF